MSAARLASWNAVANPATPSVDVGDPDPADRMGSEQRDQLVDLGQLAGQQAERDPAAHVPVRDDPVPAQPLGRRRQRLVQRPVVRRHDTGHCHLGTDAEHLAGLGSERRVGAASLDQRIERALLALQVAAVQPHALAAVGVDEDGVLHIERLPHPLPGDEQHLVVELAVLALGEQGLPEEPGAERVGVEHELHGDPLPGPATPGLPPQLGRQMGGTLEAGHRLDAAPDVLTGAGPDVDLELGTGPLVDLDVLLEERRRDAVGDPVSLVEQGQPRGGDPGIEVRVGLVGERAHARTMALSAQI